MDELDKLNNQIVVYSDGEIELKISVDEETIWFTQKHIAELFEKDVRTINEHLKAIYKEDELSENSTIRNFRIVQKEGKREVSRDVLHYNLDAVLSVGYRVNSKKATKFRQWSNKVLKDYIYNGYTINSDKITNDRFRELEHDVDILKQKVKTIDNLVVSNQILIKQGVFYDGQTYDAYIFVNDLLKSAKKEIIIIDNYIDEAVLTLLSKYKNINFTIITKSISKQLKLDVDKYNSQYSNLKIKISNDFHDRFLIVDTSKAYHIGASLKDLGKKVFAFSEINIDLILGLIK